MKSNSLKLLFSAALFLLPAMPLQAGLNAVLRMDVNCYFQAKSAASGDIVAGKVGKVRLNSKQLLQLIAREKGIKFTKGSILMATDEGAVYVADSQRTLLTDVSDLVQLEFEADVELFNGKVNVVTGKEDSRTYYPLALKLNLTDFQGTLRGIGIEDRIATAPQKIGVQVIRGNTDCSINGRGLVNGVLGYYEGKINLKGKTASVP